ncbi:MAG: InlB B-repeat-containing protein [Spirochaetota bacterium]
MRKKIAIFGLASALMLAGCALPGFDKPAEKAGPLLGSLSLRIGVPGNFSGRTIVPLSSDLPAITNYAITLTRSSSTTVTTTATSTSCSVEALDYGDWSIQVDGKTDSAAIVASGTGTVTIASTSATNATVYLDYIVAATGSSGSASVTLLFPTTQGITLGHDGVTGSLDGTDISSSLEVVDNGDSTNSKVVFSSSSIVSANPLLSITLKKGSAKLLVWTERIWVYKGITTTASVTLPNSLFAVAPPAPSSLTPSCSGYALTLTWPAVSIAESYTLERSTNAGTTWTVVASGTGLPAGTLSKTETISAGVDYLYRISAVNNFGSSEPTLSSSVGLCTVTFSSNLSLAGGTWPEKDTTTGCAEASPSSVVVLKGGTATLPTPPTYAYKYKPWSVWYYGSYSFGGWSTTSNGSVNFTASTAVTADTTVYAYWKATISYDKNASDASTISPTQITVRPPNYTMPSASAVSSPTRPNYVFGGWRVDSAGTTTLPDDVRGDMTVYAKWSAATFRSVAADSSGATLVGVKNCLGKILRSTDQGTTWTPLTDDAGATSQEKLWNHVWCSDDGQTVLAYYEASPATSSQFYIRKYDVNNTGYRWSNITPFTMGTINCGYVKLSGDGSTIAMVVGSDLLVYSGTSFSSPISSTAMGMGPTGIAVSTDGTRIIALGSSNNKRVAYYSDNRGSIFNKRNNPAYDGQSSQSGGWYGGFYTTDGSIMLFPQFDNDSGSSTSAWVSVSLDRVTWTRKTTTTLMDWGFSTVDGKPDGSLIYGMNSEVGGMQIQKLDGGSWSYVTDNADVSPLVHGGSWPALRQWSDLSASDNGLKLSAVGRVQSNDTDFQFWTSTDGGATWTKH